MERWRRSMKKSGYAVALSLDKNEQYVMSQCAAYMLRLLDRVRIMDKETIRMLAWILGGDLSEVGCYLVSRMSERERTKFQYACDDDLDDPEECPDLLAKIIRQSPKKRVQNFFPVLRSLVEKRITALSCKGGSESEKKLTHLRTMFKLTDEEHDFCRFLYIVTMWKEPEDYFIDPLACNSSSGQKYLTTVLNVSDRGLQRILGGVLARIGFYERTRYNFAVSDEFYDFFHKPASQWTSKHLFIPVSRTVIPLERHLVNTRHTEHILKLMKTTGKESMHILLYGPAGTGKTSYAHGIARKAGIPAYEILRDESNESRTRRAAVIACLNMTGGDNGSLIIVDEADNLLNTGCSWFSRGETQDKGWLNQLLEEPGARMIWITNTTENIEESGRRRFSFSLQFKPFTSGQRQQTWESVFRQNKVMRRFTEKEITDMMTRHKVNAGVVDMAVKKALLACPSSDEAFKETFLMTLDAFTLLANNGLKTRVADTIEKSYSLDGLTIEGDLPAVISQIEEFDRYLRRSGEDDRKNFNLLFYGLPGTGKSELARYLAAHLKRETISKRLSDILDCWVGSTEKNIAGAFAEAEAAEAILIIDEADSVLFSRGRAEHSWEISFTNEFLTQMERFRGILICTTNRMTDLDNASIRRFNHKLGFNYLKQDGNVVFYKKMLAALSSESVTEAVEASLRKMSSLAPGDFRVVRDRYEFYPKETVSHEMMIQALKQEINAKEAHAGKKLIGFIND